MRGPTRAVAILVALLALASACAPAGELTGQPATPGPYTVLVDLYSGQRNPEVELSAPVAEQVYRELAGRAGDFGPGEEPASVLGFRGFVVTPGDGSIPVLRITTDTVYATRVDGVTVLADPEGRYYDLVLSDVKPRLAPGVVDALP